MQILDKSLTPCFKAGTVSHHPAATGSASAVMYHGPGKKTNEKAPWSCSYLQKTLWLLWCGITYTVKNIIIYIREYKPERFQWSSHATPFLWKGQQQGFPLLVLQDSVKAVSTFCACLWPLGSLCLSGWDREMLEKLQGLLTSTKILDLEELTVTRRYHSTYYFHFGE